MRNLGRRSVLKALAAVPLSGPAAAQAVKQMVAPLAGAGLVGGSVEVASSAENPGRAFTSFASWLADGGEAELRRNSRAVSGFDPDIMELSLPMPTKVRMQRQRNYERNREERYSWFMRRLRKNGIVKDWF